jgi:hypothetical protein
MKIVKDPPSMPFSCYPKAYPYGREGNKARILPPSSQTSAPSSITFHPHNELLRWARQGSHARKSSFRETGLSNHPKPSCSQPQHFLSLPITQGLKPQVLLKGWSTQLAICPASQSNACLLTDVSFPLLFLRGQV